MYDGQGSTRQLTDDSGNLVTDQVFNYDGYGVMVGYTGTPQTNLLYTGEYFDAALKQYNLRARYYNPLNGRFNQTDPYFGNTQDPQSLHKYLYCHNNPINNIDPSGTFSLTETISVASTIMNVTGKIMTAITVAKYGYRAGGIILKLTSGEEELVDEAFLEAEDLVEDLVIDATVIIATFGLAKFLQNAVCWLRGSSRVAAVARFNRNIEFGAKAERYILGATTTKKAFTTSLGKVVPDKVTSVIEEVKNVKYLSKSTQMKKLMELAGGGNGEPARKLILYVRPDTKMSDPLKEALEELGRKGLYELKETIPNWLSP